MALADALARIRTGTPCGTAPSRQRVYQFHHQGGLDKLETGVPGVKRHAALAIGAARPHTPAMLRVLDADKILETLERLGRRVRERFPDAGLNNVAAELLAIGRDTKRRAASVNRPYPPVRVLAVTLIALLLIVVVLGATASLQVTGRIENLGSLMQALEATVNDLVFVGVAIWFLATIETRIKRRAALRGIHELRSIAHVVDMHQLTKDPEQVLGLGPGTSSSPDRPMTRFELARYLDYCSEMLSLTSKLAVLYVQRLDDPAVLAAVNDVQALTGGLANKIWQKIVILDTSPRPAPY